MSEPDLGCKIYFSAGLGFSNSIVIVLYVLLNNILM